MSSSFLKLLGFAALLVSGSEGTHASILESRSVLSTCKAIAAAVSHASTVYYPGSANYTADNNHWDLISIENSTCSVEPGTAADVGKILEIVGSTRTPFGVKGAGHATNEGFSATTGVQIALTRFNEVLYHPATGTADVGPGLTWDQVYTALEPYNVTIVGGRVSDVGVAGLSLGGGYSFKTNEYGLAIDNIVGYELVLPNGTITHVTNISNSDLFFALKGGFNNYGIVTKFTFNAYHQGPVWGGIITFSGEDSLLPFTEAIANYSATVTDPKAAIITNFFYQFGVPGGLQTLFYDAAEPPSGLFDQFLNIPNTTLNIGTRSYRSLIEAFPTDSSANIGLRVNYHAAALRAYTQNVLNVIINETIFWGEKASALDSQVYISYATEPFLNTLFDHGPDTAYPPDRSKQLLPQNIWFGWTDKANDEWFQDALRQTSNTIRDAAVKEGQDVATAALYPNYALFSTTSQNIYGAHLPRLQAIKKVYDPENVMGLTGGFKI